MSLRREVDHVLKGWHMGPVKTTGDKLTLVLAGSASPLSEGTYVKQIGFYSGR